MEPPDAVNADEKNCMAAMATLACGVRLSKWKVHHPMASMDAQRYFDRLCAATAHRASAIGCVLLRCSISTACEALKYLWLSM
jgi:hypothetical protein